jgi:hypothetical protein
VPGREARLGWAVQVMACMLPAAGALAWLGAKSLSSMARGQVIEFNG